MHFCVSFQYKINVYQTHVAMDPALSQARHTRAIVTQVTLGLNVIKVLILVNSMLSREDYILLTGYLRFYRFTVIYYMAVTYQDCCSISAFSGTFAMGWSRMFCQRGSTSDKFFMDFDQVRGGPNITKAGHYCPQRYVI